jgi:insertion element IS1 protein InsB
MVIGTTQAESSMAVARYLSKYPASGSVRNWDRSEATWRKLWDKIPDAYRDATCSTDFWKASAAVVPDDQHEAVGKETGETAHVARFNNTIRQRWARLVRKTLSFAKSSLLHDSCLRFLLWRYTMEMRQKGMATI